MYANLFFLDPVVGFESEVYQVMENFGVLKICVVVHKPSITDSPIEFDFDINIGLSATAGTFVF